jgi:hypothetical protein
MGRGFGDGIYDSDMALDYESTITDRLERDIAYWVTPEQIDRSSWWLAQVFCIIQTMLLFEEGNIGSTVYLQHEAAVRRWREVILSVWDGDWKGEKIDYPYGDPDYRKQHRPAIFAMFDRLDSIAHLWTTIGSSSTQIELTPLLLDYPLPYFLVRGARLIYDLMELFRKDIIYRLSAETRNDALEPV